MLKTELYVFTNELFIFRLALLHQNEQTWSQAKKKQRTPAEPTVYSHMQCFYLYTMVIHLYLK